jgi:hypothetical protein
MIDTTPAIHYIKKGSKITVDDNQVAVVTKISILPRGLFDKETKTISKLYRVYYKRENGTQGHKDLAEPEQGDVKFVVSN